jgi:hypothetical protein
VEKYRKTINILIFLLIITVGLCIYAFLRKGNAVPAVSLFMYKKDAQYFPQSKDPAFWDNYPYWILISQGEKLNPDDYLDDDDNMQEKPDLFFRLYYREGQDSLLRATLPAIFKHKGNIAIIADDQSFAFLQSFGSPPSVKVLKIHEQLPLHMEQLKLSYFFVLSGADNAVGDIFVPRIELPEVTVRYLDHFSNQK